MSGRSSLVHHHQAKHLQNTRRASVTQAIHASRRNFGNDQSHSYVNGNYRPNLLADAILCDNHIQIAKHCQNRRMVTRFKARLAMDHDFVHRISKQRFMIYCLEYLNNLEETDRSQLSSEQSLWVSAILLYIREAIYLTNEDPELVNRSHAIPIVTLFNRSQNPGLKGKLLSDICRLMTDLMSAATVDNRSFILKEICWPIHKDLFYFILRCGDVNRFLRSFSPEICSFYRVYLVELGGKVHKENVC
jgi:hypothetical protein